MHICMDCREEGINGKIATVEYDTSSILGLTINCPPILPIRTTPMGPPQGISDNIRAADVALAASISGSCFPSEERTLAITYETSNSDTFAVTMKQRK